MIVRVICPFFFSSRRRHTRVVRSRGLGDVYKRQVEKGPMENPTLTLTMDSQDYVDMIAGRLNGMSAFMSGKLQLDGDIMLATRLFTMFKMGK